ncbi:MAG: TetR/AcrR family transcriptional regulator [Acidobacteriota bacterium]|nr:TetR/AcrR family transcriptional regulator [Acidobacteriota bacterium]MDE3190849.1 TetR/AcrR family transcriptional regulator [Acidobacteriota bacterium]
MTRLSAAERKDDVLEAAIVAFAGHGLEGTSTEDIARRAGISQPYLFRLFGTKKELFIASVRRCFRETLELFQRAAEGERGEEALRAIGEAYQELLRSDRTRLRMQMQSYAAAAEDAEVRDVVRAGYGDLVAYVRRVSGADWPEVWQFFATGMMLNVLASMGFDDTPEPWMAELLAGCGKEI